VRQVFDYQFIVPDDAVDENGHVNNVVFVQWMQDAAIRHSDVTGCTQATFQAGCTWVVRSHQIEYLRPAYAGDQITVFTWVTNFRRVRSVRKYKFVRSEDNCALAKGMTDWVFVAMDSGLPRAVPADIKAMFELVPEEQEADLVG
jgi:acyl-CoA thioester hydrolase